MKYCVVTGGRRYGNPCAVWKALDAINPDVVIHGDYGVVDLAAKAWGERYAKEHGYDPEFHKLGGRGGPKRNRRMATVAQALREFGDEVICIKFPGGRGTANCVQELEKRGLTVLDGEALQGREAMGEAE